MTAICRITYMDQICGKPKTEYIAITKVQTFTDTMTNVEDYYGEDLISVTIDLIEDTFLFLDNKTYEEILKGKTSYECNSN